MPLMASDHHSSGLVLQCPTMALEHNILSLSSQCQEKVSEDNTLGPEPQSQENVPIVDTKELEVLSGPMFDEYFNGASKVVPKSYVVTTIDASDKSTTVNANENINQAENVMFDEDDFINPFGTSVHEVGESSSRHVDPSNMHTFYQQHHSEYHWKKDHPLEKVFENSSQPVRTRRQLDTDGEMCMFSLTVSRVEPKIIKEAMVDHAWIEAIQEELYQFK
ncbi:hypothetical protein Tco_1133301 [Tanacetum coccineum]